MTASNHQLSAFLKLWLQLLLEAFHHRLRDCLPRSNRFLQTKRELHRPREPDDELANRERSLYVTNLPSAKIQKDDLRTALYMLFSTYGPVLDVVALKTMKMRGQAHIVFRDIQASTQAMRSLNGASFLGRDLVRIIVVLLLARIWR